MHDAQRSINELTRRQKIVIEFLPGHTYAATAPSLLAQLRAAAGASNGGRGGRTVPGSRLPVNADALDLWTHVLYDTHTWAHHLHINRRPYVEGPLTGEGLGDMTLPLTGRLLRAVFAQAVARGRDELAERVGHRAGVWGTQIRGMLTGHRGTYPLRGHACEACGAREVVETRDGERYHMPAVQATLALPEDGRDTLWPYLVCLACGDNGWAPYRHDSYAADVARTLFPPFGEAAA